MATPINVKRMTREKGHLCLSSPDYFAHIHDSDLLHFSTYVVGPADTLYAHKFVKINFTIPSNYPFSPPICHFVQHSGDRLHPNLYNDCGKVCLSILGTWPGEPWSQAMSVESVLITLRSLLDNSPYQHEPHQRDNPAFNAYVQYCSWRCLLLDYLARETEPHAKAFLSKYLMQHGDEMLGELRRQQDDNRNVKQFISPYSRSGAVKPDYDALVKELSARVNEAKEPDAAAALAIQKKVEVQRLKEVVLKGMSAEGGAWALTGERIKNELRPALSEEDFAELKTMLLGGGPAREVKRKADADADAALEGEKHSQKRQAVEFVDLT